MRGIRIDKEICDFDIIPDECPHCHKSIHVNFVGHYVYANDEGEMMDLIFSCPNQSCLKAFISTYNRWSSNEFGFRSTSFGTTKKYKFSKEINTISPNFSEIFNQSSFAEQRNLLEVCGVGYRKALEFLMKDYLTSTNPKEAEKIASKFLGNCIRDYVKDPRILTVSKRASWLGNDETHYVRVWNGKNLNDLKKLIELTVHWIEMEMLTQSFNEEMPDKKSITNQKIVKDQNGESPKNPSV